MKKFYRFIVSILLIPLILIGCQSTVDDETPNDEISKVSLSNSNTIGQINTNFFTVYEDEEVLETFQNIFTSAVKQEGIVDIAEPEFDLEVIYKEGNKQEYHLWLGEKDEQSTLMQVEDTHTIYTISEEATNQLIDLVN
ncbi:MAG TPA: hypothetical protein VFC64_03465 [Atopostipes sp.]|nr:hypothetical protein [Atopostipes sp.]